MTIRGGSIRVMHPLFQEGQGGSIPTPPLSAKSLIVEQIEFGQGKVLNRLWHSRLPRIGDDTRFAFLSFVAEYQGVAYAVAIWSHPVNRSLPQDTWLELRRLAIAPDAPRNTASRMLRVMALLVRKKRPEVVRLISYQDMDIHTGTIYAAAGWVKTTVNKDGTWDRPNRSRPKAQSNAPKQRWEKEIVS